MKQKTQEEIRDAVLAFCERVCDENPADPEARWDLGLIRKSKRNQTPTYSIEFGDGYSLTVFGLLEASDVKWPSMYRLLGLETSDAVAESNEFLKLQQDQITRIVAKNAALVEAMKEASGIIQRVRFDGDKIERLDVAASVMVKAIDANSRAADKIRAFLNNQIDLDWEEATPSSPFSAALAVFEGYLLMVNVSGNQFDFAWSIHRREEDGMLGELLAHSEVNKPKNHAKSDCRMRFKELLRELHS